MVFFPVVVKHVEMIPNTPSMSVMITVLVWGTLTIMAGLARPFNGNALV
jgi:hypothetical protein